MPVSRSSDQWSARRCGDPGFLPAILSGHVRSRPSRDRSAKTLIQDIPTTTTSRRAAAPRTRSAGISIACPWSEAKSSRSAARSHDRVDGSRLPDADRSARSLRSEPGNRSHQKLYGEGDFARGCLMARRLVERGVRMVQVYYDQEIPGTATRTSRTIASSRIAAIKASPR